MQVKGVGVLGVFTASGLEHLQGSKQQGTVG
jgi:hypothetical protein